MILDVLITESVQSEKAKGQVAIAFCNCKLLEELRERLYAPHREHCFCLQVVESRGCYTYHVGKFELFGALVFSIDMYLLDKGFREEVLQAIQKSGLDDYQLVFLPSGELV